MLSLELLRLHFFFPELLEVASDNTEEIQLLFQRILFNFFIIIIFPKP